MSKVCEAVGSNLLPDLKMIQLLTSNFRCLYLRNKSLIKRELFIEILEDVLNNTNISFYYCNIGVFVLSPMIHFDSLVRIINRMAKVTHFSEEKIEKSIALFDVEKDWDSILNDVIDNADLPNFDAIRKLRPQKVVLIVEDDRFTAELIDSHISGDFKKVIAYTGGEAVYLYLQEAPNIVFLDIELPDINGHEVLENLQKIDENVYAVMLTGNGTVENISKAVKHNVNGFIAKPFSRDHLLSHLEQCFVKEKGKR